MISSPFRRTSTLMSSLHRARGMCTYVSIDGQRKKRSLPHNTVIKFVPQQEAWVIERFGRFNRLLDPGLAILFPIIDEIKYVQSLKEVALEIPSQSAITLDNVTLSLDGVLYFRVVDPFKASYGVEDAEYAITQLAQTTMRSELGKISLDNVFQERSSLNHLIVEAINTAAEVWGIKILRYEIRDILLPAKVKEAMQMQVEAERKKRAAILESEGQRMSAINVAEGKKQSQILASEARKMEQINIATGEAQAILAKANARAEGIKLVSASLTKQFGDKAASLSVAEQYVQAFSKLAKVNNTVILPANAGDVSSMVAQAMAVYGQLIKPPTDTPPDDETPGRKDRAPDVPEHETVGENITLPAHDNKNPQISSEQTVRNPDVDYKHFSFATSPTRLG